MHHTERLLAEVGYTLNVAKMQCKLRVASGLNLPWYGSTEWNMEENCSMEWKMEWKIFSMEWKWNGRKFPEWNMEKSSSIPYHALQFNIHEAHFLLKIFEVIKQ